MKNYLSAIRCQFSNSYPDVGLKEVCAGTATILPSEKIVAVRSKTFNALNIRYSQYFNQKKEVKGE